LNDADWSIAVSANVVNVSALSDADWSIAALEREEDALTNFLEAIC
jgi:hypothetical protein